MVGSVVHDQHDSLIRIALQQQILQERDEGLTILSVYVQRRYIVCAPVVGTDEMMVLARVGRCRQALLLTTFQSSKREWESVSLWSFRPQRGAQYGLVRPPF